MNRCDPTGAAFLQAMGHEIRARRQLHRLTRAQLATSVGISETTMGRIEREGPVDVGITWHLAQRLGMSFAELARRAEETAAIIAATP